ncbi:MAG: rhodanese-like domain-containing protein [SAR202 cluster bacterium]|jgi:rhodanese-related sulfurtransferase|nr:rhodanese-like domain-containing protein [SAR202 cluster bacterium]MDP7224450.1 rhodanese-like domain-containing protein [SAR202 cluster bacterium]HJO81060.1 rhodanese-like domain-containing protein [SAR202 cluster bacterium]
MPEQVQGEPYFRLTLEEATEMYNDDDVVVVDVRRTDEYLEGHVKGAIFITVDDILARMDDLPDDKKLLFICAAGVRSGLACEMAAAMGVESERLYNIMPGTEPWIEAGHPTSYGADE